MLYVVVRVSRSNTIIIEAQSSRHRGMAVEGGRSEKSSYHYNNDNIDNHSSSNIY
jgi:hypothetical protein